jgi:ribosomal protein S12 methylthiotransferase accessory factor
MNLPATFNDATSGYKRLKDIAPFLVDDETGIVAYIQELKRQFDSPDFIYYKAEIGNTGIFGLEEHHPATGGTSLDRDRAIAKALGEAVERYSSAVFFPQDMIVSSHRDLGEDAIHPERFAIHTPQQLAHRNFPLDPFNEQSAIRWTPATHLATGTQKLIPAASVYCPYTADSASGEANVIESISTGLAAHCSYKEAAINAILEVVERDRFMMHWLAMIPCPVIEPQSLTPLHREMLARYAAYGYEITVLYATPDTGIPTVFCVMHGKWEGCVPFIISSATHLDPDAAITKCLEELALMERLCKRIMLTAQGWSAGRHYENIVVLADHLYFWINPAMISHADFLVSKTRRISLQDIPNMSTGDPEEDLETIVQRVENSGYEVYISDVTASDVEDLGMKVLRAVIPGYIPLTVHYRCRPEGSKRLQECLRKRQQANAKDITSVNPVPHPFA